MTGERFSVDFRLTNGYRETYTKFWEKHLPLKTEPRDTFDRGEL